MIRRSSPDELERAIGTRPSGVGVGVEPALVAEIVADVADQPGALPLLQYALTELFDRRTTATLTPTAYRESAGSSGALARRAEAGVRRLTRAGREAARQLFLRLVTVGGRGATTRDGGCSDRAVIAGGRRGGVGVGSTRSRPPPAVVRP